MNLEQLQAEWRAKWSQSSNGLGAAVGLQCADSLAPHILQQERDRELMSRLLAVVEKSPGSFPWLCDAARSRLKEME